MTDQEFDNVLESIRNDVPESPVIEAATARVRSRLAAEAGGVVTDTPVDHLNSCADFRALQQAYRAGTLSEARKMLVEDHLHSCVACRRVFQGIRASVTPMSTTATVAARRPNLGRKVIPWAIAAAIVLAAAATMPPVLDRVFAPSGPRATVASVEGNLYRVSDQGLTPLASGANLDEHDQIRTAKGSRAVVQLRDGSRIEMAERSALTLSEHWSGKTVYLDRGSVMIEAAKQRRGRLEVVTPDCAVSVKGTIFEVSRGTKGSRVSVVEGEVKVDQEGASKLLHFGDQTATNVSMLNTSVAEDIAWSSNSAKYLALMTELSTVSKKIDALPGPGLRYQSKLAAYVPQNTVIFAAIPNLAPVLSDATNVFEERVAQSPVLKQWWNEKETQQLRAIVNQVKTFGDYLGDEIVLAVPAVNGQMQEPVVIAAARRPGLSNFLEQQFATLKSSGGSAPLLVSDPHDAAQHAGLAAMVRGNVVVLGSATSMANMAATIDAGGNASAFPSTPLWARVEQNYKSGTGWIFAADMEQIVNNHVIPHNVNATASAPSISGFDNVRFLVVERKQNMGKTENSASLSFTGERHGLMSWLAQPGPMGTLDFVSPEASFATSFVIKNPGTLLPDLINMTGSAEPMKIINDFQIATSVNLLNDVAANLGGEMTLAFDGPLLPTPSWKAIFEVDNPARLEWAFEQAVATGQQKSPEMGIQLTNLQVNGLTGHALKSPKLPFEIDYVFTDGYLLMGSSQTVLESAIESRISGASLPRSAAFRAQLPQDGHVNFSAILYYNMGSMVGPVVDQLKASGLMNPEQQKAAGALTANREPGLIYAYGEADRIVVASRSGFFGLDLSTLVGLNAKGAALTQLLPLNLISNPMNSKRRAVN